MSTAFNASPARLAAVTRPALHVIAVALLLLTSCKKAPPPLPTVPDPEGLAGSVVLALLVEHEPEEYPPDLLREKQGGIPALAATYTLCTSEQKESVRRFVRGFLDYEDNQYADLCRWYLRIENAIASGDRQSRNMALKTQILSEHTESLVASLPPRVRQLAEYQMKGMQDLPGILQRKIPTDSPLAAFDARAGREAAAKFDLARKQSYAKTYSRITQEELRN